MITYHKGSQPDENIKKNQGDLFWKVRVFGHILSGKKKSWPKLKSIQIILTYKLEFVQLQK